MPDGDFRRAPRLPEQQILARIDAANAGVMGSSVASVVPSEPSPTPGGTGSDQEPPYYADLDTDTPAAPNVAQVIAGLAVTWTGTDTAGDPYPPGIHAEIHVSAASGFTPSSLTLKGTLALPGTLTVSGLTAGTDYYAVIVVVDEQGETAQSAQSGPVSAGFVTTTAIGTGTITEDLVSFDATAIGGIQQFVGTGTPSTSAALGSTWVNTSNGSYNVLEDVAGTPTWVQRQWDSGGIAADAITSTQIAAGAVIAESIAAQAITSKLVSGEVIRTSTADAGARVRLSSTDGIEVYSSSGRVFHASPSGTVTISGYATTGDISGFITAGQVNSNVTSISGGTITSGTISGVVLESSSSGNRVRIDSGDRIVFYYSGGVRAELAGVIIDGNNGLGLTGSLDINGNLYTTYNIIVGSGMAVLPEGSSNLRLMAGKVQTPGYLVCQNVYDYYGSVSANVYVATDGKIYRATSSERYKFRIVPLMGELQDVPADKVSTPEAEGAVDIWDVLDLAPAQFASLEHARREVDPETGEEITPAPERTFLGFIAEDVAAKFPIAAEWNDDGEPESYDYRAILSALLGVVREQQSIITDLTARVEALEG